MCDVNRFKEEADLLLLLTASSPPFSSFVEVLTDSNPHILLNRAFAGLLS